MASYYGHKHVADIDGMAVKFDSDLEERVLRELLSRGFHGRWRRPEIGISHRNFNYTPDLELSVGGDGMDHRAIVEIKPSLKFFGDDISRRMRRAAKHYPADLLLLYTDDDKKWRRIDRRTGMTQEVGFPEPGNLTIDQLYKPLSVKSRSVYNHHYAKRFSICEALWRGLKLLWEPPYQNRKVTRRRRRK